MSRCVIYNHTESEIEAALKSLDNIIFLLCPQGNISRQEAVSMIPPILLDVQPHHKVVDIQLCDL